eukprot:4826696-Prymnesium_polylepis.1
MYTASAMRPAPPAAIGTRERAPPSLGASGPDAPSSSPPACPPLRAASAALRRGGARGVDARLTAA